MAKKVMVSDFAKKALAVGGVALVALGGGYAIGALTHPVTKTVTVVEQAPPQIVEVQVPVEVIKEVQVTSEVLVDNGKLGTVLQYAYDNDGQMEVVTDGLDDDEINLIVDRIVFVNDAREMSLQYVKDKGINELDDEELNGTVLDRRDIERFKLYDDAKDVIVDDIDFDDEDAELLVSAKFEQDDVKYDAQFRVFIKDGEVDDLEVVEVSLR